MSRKMPKIHLMLKTAPELGNREHEGKKFSGRQNEKGKQDAFCAPSGGSRQSDC